MISNNFEQKKLNIINLYKEKKFLDTIKLGTKLIDDYPDDPQLIYILGLTSINLQNFTQAERYFEKLISIKTTSEVYYIFGNIKKKLNKNYEAISFFEKSIKLNPKFSEAYNNLGNTKKLVNERDQAEYYYKKAISLKEDNIQALFNLSTILKENNDYKNLILIYEKILKLDENNIKTNYNIGSAYLFLGEIQKGRKFFEKVIKIDNFHIPSLRNYISITKIDKKNQIFKKLEKIDLNNLNNDNKVLMLNALSKGYLDMDNKEQGFKYLNKSNLLKKKKSDFSMKTQERQFNKIKSFFADIDNTKLEFDNKIVSNPIFIVGMPRSGTSLLEQILSSHSKIYGAGELNYLQKIIDQLGIDNSNYSKDYFKKIRDYYYSHLIKISQNHFIIDKLPINFKWIGFITKSFPEAKILHIKRNPMAVCWSNYKTHFVDKGMDFNLTQEDVANYYSLYIDLMNFWSKKFEKNILEIEYENFVQDFQRNTKKILGFLNLDWEDKIINYEKNHRSVSTASYQQVREKIKKNTSEQWKIYKDYLVKMQETLVSNKINF